MIVDTEGVQLCHKFYLIFHHLSKIIIAVIFNDKIIPTRTK